MEVVSQERFHCINTISDLYELCYDLLINTSPYLIVIFQSPDYWVSVHSLKSFRDGGILDSDDTVADVADDREQVGDN